MSDRPVVYGPWQRGSWCMRRQILPPPVGEALPVVEVDWNTSAGSEPDWRTDYDPREVAAELVRVAKERDRLEQAVLVEIDNRDRAYASIDAIADQLGVEEEWSNLHDRGECAVEAAAALEAERDRAVKAAAEAGLVLEGIRLAVTYELAPEILVAIDQALELVHAVIVPMGAIRTE